MCGKFTALASWSEVVEFSQPLTERGGGGVGDGLGEGSNDEVITFRVGGLLPVIVWDAEARKRRVVRIQMTDLPALMLACVMATVPANKLIRRTIKSQEDDPQRRLVEVVR